MNTNEFYTILVEKAQELGLNPLLVLSGIEGVYSFKDVKLDSVNYALLDSLILTILTLRIGDRFHSLAEAELNHQNPTVRQAARRELSPLDTALIMQSENDYLKSFAQVLQGRSIIRLYHVKALEVAALEIKKAQLQFKSSSIGAIMIDLCQTDLKESLSLSSLFAS